MPVYNNPDSLESKIADFSLKGIDDNFYSPQDFRNKDILIIIFICNHCPYVKAVMERLVAFQKKYSNRKVQMIGINPNDAVAYPEDSFDNMKKFAEKYEMNFPYLIDETQEIAKKYGAVCTPDIYVYDSERNLKYRGRLDDSWKDETKISSKDLEKAVDLLLEGKEISFLQIPSMGCSIKWKN